MAAPKDKKVLTADQKKILKLKEGLHGAVEFLERESAKPFNQRGAPGAYEAALEVLHKYIK